MPHDQHSMSVPSPAKRGQFGLRALLWTILVMSIALAYLKQFDSTPIFLGSVAVLVIATVGGVAIGWPAGRSADSAYWSAVISTAAYLSVAGERAYGPLFVYAWSAVGIAAGAVGGMVAPNHPIRRMLVSGLFAGLTMFAFAPFLQAGAIELAFDLACAPVVGALVGLLINWILWLESRSSIPRYVTASWLLLAVIVGNFLVPLVRG